MLLEAALRLCFDNMSRVENSTERVGIVYVLSKFRNQ